MRVAVTGAAGKVGRAATLALLRDGHEVRAVDLSPPVFERDLPDEPHQVQADLTDAGEAFAVLRGMEAVVHAGAIPSPGHHADHRVFANNLMAVFNTVEAAVRWGARRFVNISSETVPGFFFAERPFLPDYAPVDEDHPIRPQDPYALAKHFGEQLMDAAVRRSDLRVVTLRPSWVQWEGNYERNLGPMVRDASVLSEGLWSYIDLYDLADAVALAVQSDLPGHEICYIASPDNATGRDFAEILRTYYGDQIELRETQRADASGIDTRKAQRLLGWHPTRSWRDYLDENGRLRDELHLPEWAAGMTSLPKPRSPR
jgi:UDP-glucose 4-epimerase